ncbi:hypothetical protein AGMMS50218_01760 [Actinomycetota bacterium]|nr:hypothetical protein AGMMS50218_01760 [Actinomycetota bacterium]
MNTDSSAGDPTTGPPPTSAPGPVPGAGPGPAPTPPGTPGTPGPGGPTGPNGPSGVPSGPDGFFGAVRRIGIVRTDDRWIGGVAGGVALRFGIDPLLVRGIFGVSVLLGGLGLVAYGVGWALLPEQRDGRIHLEETIRGRFDIAMLGALALVVAGLGSGNSWFGWWGSHGFGWVKGLLWIAVIVVGVALATTAARQRRAQRPPHGPGRGPAGPWTPPPGSAPYASPYPTPYSSTHAPAAAAGPTTPGAPTMPMPPVPPAPTSAAPPTQPLPSWSAAPPHGGWSGPPQPPVPPRPPRPHVQGPGAAMLGAVVALTLLVLAGLLIAQRTDSFDGPVALTTLGIGVVLAGLGIIASGLRGRSSGSLGFVAIVAIVVALPMSVVEHNDWNWHSERRGISDDSFVVTSRSAAEGGYSLGVGDSTIDLSGVDLTRDTLDVPISMGLGSLTVIVPDGVAVTADIRTGAGDVTWAVDDGSRKDSGLGIRQTYSSDEVRPGRDAQIALDIELGAGDVTIEEN